ncbi:hypothetical protein [Kribbella sp. C-35]|uniref:hypothetical protein n=1 Tax=Kribbella sp. C-35 TaxID=2789276 RepID=UPI00397E88AE
MLATVPSVNSALKRARSTLERQRTDWRRQDRPPAAGSPQEDAIVTRFGRAYSLVPTRANGQPAFGAYVLGADGVRRGTSLFVVAVAGDRICAMTRFESTVFEAFGLPLALPGR